MTIGALLTGGLGNGTFNSTIPLLLTEGLDIGEAVVVEDTAVTGGWLSPEQIKAFLARQKALDDAEDKRRATAQLEKDRLEARLKAVYDRITGVEPEKAAEAPVITVEAKKEVAHVTRRIRKLERTPDLYTLRDIEALLSALDATQEALSAYEARLIQDDEEAMMILMVAV